MLNFAFLGARETNVSGNIDGSHQVSHLQWFVQTDTQKTYSCVIYLYAELLRLFCV